MLILAHVKELLDQTAGTLRHIAPDLDVGVYSAGLKRGDTDHPVIVAGIQSVYQRACELDRFDECGLVTGETPTGERDRLIARFKGDPVAARHRPRNAPSAARSSMQPIQCVPIAATNFLSRRMENTTPAPPMKAS